MKKTNKLISVFMSLFMLIQIGMTAVSADVTQQLSTPTNFKIKYDSGLNENLFVFDKSTPSSYVDRYVFEIFLVSDYTLFNTRHSYSSEDTYLSMNDLQNEFELQCEHMGFNPANTKLAIQVLAVSNNHDICANSDYSPLIGIDGKVIDDNEILYTNGGSAGANSNWKFSRDGILTVSGVGAAEVDAYDVEDRLKKIIIEEGITSIKIGQQMGYLGVEEIYAYNKNLDALDTWKGLPIDTNSNKPILYTPSDSVLYRTVMEESDENHATITVIDISDQGTNYRTLLGEDVADAAKVVSDLEIIPQIYALRNQKVTKSKLALAMTRLEQDNIYVYVDTSSGSYDDLEDGTFETGCANYWLEVITPNSETDYGKDDEVTYEQVVNAIKYANPNVEIGLTGKSATDKVTYTELTKLIYQALTPDFLMKNRESRINVFKGSADFFYDDYQYKARLNGKLEGEFSIVGHENVENEEYNIKDMDLLDLISDDDITLYLQDGGDIVSGLLSTYNLEPAGYSADFIINGGIAETTNKTISIALSATGYTKYKIGSGSFSNITSSPISYTLDSTHGNKIITVTFADNSGNTKTISKSIKLNNLRSITYMVDGKEFKKVSVGCGLAIIPIEDEPVKAGFEFDGWDGLPDIMPDNDITVTAKFVVESPLASGTCGESAVWSLSNSGLLIISGTGVIESFPEYREYHENIKNIVINKGITEIGDNAFYELFNMESISIPNTVKTIGGGLVKGSLVTKIVIPESVISIKMNMAFLKCPENIEVYFMNKDIELICEDGGEYVSYIKLYGYKDSDVSAYAENHSCEFAEIDPDFTINDGATETSVADITLKFNNYALDFEQYKVNDSAYTTLTGDTVNYTVDNTDGEKAITVTFKKGNFEIAKTHKITFNNKHKITYVSENTTIDEAIVGCGTKIIPTDKTASKEGYTFLKWDVPEIMPDNDVISNAMFVKNLDSTSLDSVLTEEEKTAGISVKSDIAILNENTSIQTELVNKYSEYTASIILNIEIYKIKENDNTFTPINVTETENLLTFVVDIPEGIQGKTEYIILRDHNGMVDVLTTSKNPDGEHIEVKNNTIIIHAKKFSAYQLLAKDAAPTPTIRVGGGSGSSKYTVKFETNGGTTISNLSVDKNKTVTEPVAPTRDGYTFEGWYTDSGLTIEYDFNLKVTKNFTLYAKWTEVEKELEKLDTTKWKNPFKDVKETDWFYENVEYVVNNKLINGLSEDEFAPNNNLTRAMLVTVLYRNESEPAINKSILFADVDMSAYYANAVIWAQQNNIVSGISESEFAPNNNITREQIATIIHRYAQFKGFDIAVGENTNILSYEDFSNISEYAISAVRYAIGSGLMKGRTAITINPKDFVTRAEMATILQRFLNNK